MCASISLFGLLARLVYQCANVHLRNTSGWHQFNIVLALFIGLLCQISSPFMSDWSVICEMVAVLRLTSFLSTYFLMSLLVFDFHFMISALPELRQMSTCSKIISLILAWVIPLIFSGLICLLDHLDIEAKWQPGFSPNCWLSNPYPLMIYFIIPISFSCLANTVSFVVSSITLKRLNSAIIHFHHSEDYTLSFLIFLIIGVSWLVYILSVYVTNPTVWYISLVFTTLEGVGIFALSLCCMKRKLDSVQSDRES